MPIAVIHRVMDIPDPKRRGRGLPFIEYTSEADKHGGVAPTTKICTVIDGGQWRDVHDRVIRYYANHSLEPHDEDDPHGK